MKNITDDILASYSKLPAGEWLNTFDWKAVKVSKMPFIKEGFMVAMFIGPLNLVLLEDPFTTKETFSVWATDVIHEFYHAYQYHTLGPIKYLFKKVFNRKALEEEAVNASITWLDNYMENI